MHQTASPKDALPQTLKNLLQPDEQLLWLDSPRMQKLRFPLALTSKTGVFDLLFDAILAFLLTAFFSWMVSGAVHKSLPFWIDMLLFICLFFLFSLRSFLKTFIVALKKAPPYRRHTLYAITDHRAMIIVCLPGNEPTILSYSPHEIDHPMSHVRSDGSGILVFGAPRHTKIGRFGPDVAFLGSFLGISHVQEVAALLQRLKCGNS